NGAHELASEPLALELVGERRVEPDEEAPLLRAREAFGRRRLDQERLGRKLDALPADLRVVCLAARGRRRDRRRVSRRKILADRRYQLAVTLTEERQIRLDPVAHELRVAREQLER